MIDNNSVENTEDVEDLTTEQNNDVKGEQDNQQQESNTESQMQEKKYTDEEVDRIVSKRLNRERERLSRLFNEEQQKSDIEVREKKIEERERKADIKDKLDRDNLPRELSELIDCENAEEIESNYEKVINIFKISLSGALKEKFKGTAPRVGRIPDHDNVADAFSPKHR
ncbi:MAG: DUF4355 domain-containing protein [Anaerostipes sp.]|nr:DUF4355 domain-containing protein [Anaerostipes sp.]MDD3747500.1 DUF4355 domain-containing protein [Anaerostipes sp.]MDD4371281.1 DUF4355 domain-containing protein [Anaerostipes sp.]